jgi:hypothetical protein
MRICLYNSFGNIEAGSFDKIIWCPLSRDIVHTAEFFRKYYDATITLKIESAFKKYFTGTADTDISFFDSLKLSAGRKERLIAFYSQSDTLADNTYCLISENPHYKYINYVPSGKAENADHFFAQKNIPYHRYSYRHLRGSRPDILVLYNDWTKAALRIIAHCHLLRIPVVCIQESIIDFGDSFRRMQHADDVMIQGVRSAAILPRNHFFLTGNPRYSHSLTANKAAEYALINCNFTYNILEEVRAAWLDDVTSALDEAGINYFISQHPRDNGDLGKYKNVIRSSSTGLDEQLGKAGLLITRFSSLIHESLIRGVPVIYYNPHNENMQYDFDFNLEFLMIAREKNSLKEYSAMLYKKDISGKGLESYLNEHCLPAETKPVSTINYLLSENDFSNVKFTFSDLLHLILYRPFLINFVQKFRKTLPGLFKPVN